MKIINPLTKGCVALMVLASIILFACKKNPGSDSNPTTETAPDLTTKVAATLISGFITNENDVAVKSATIEVGGINTSTDKYGYFEVRNAQVIQNAATVTISKPGYFKTVKTFTAAAGKSAFFRIKLLPKISAGTINAVSGGSVTVSGGMVISIPAAVVVNANTNAAYTGIVTVLAQLISASDPNLNRIMPGDLRGLNTNGNMRLLTTYGMMAVELTGSGGELLQIANGKKAGITMPIPAAMQSSAPVSIPLWYFDEAKGLWKEEGSATKTGSNYIGEVSHFSFWNCDVPGSYVQFNCTVVNTAGQPIQNAFVKITVVGGNNFNTAYGYTDSAGYVNGLIPDNTQLLIQIFGNNICSTPSYSQTITSTNTNLSLGNITISTSLAIASISGTVKNCNNTPVLNGYVILQNGSLYSRYPLNSSGAFNFSQLICTGIPNNIILIGEDIASLQQSNPGTYAVVAGNNLIPSITACQAAAQQYITYTVNNISYTFTSPADTFDLYNGTSTGVGNTYFLVGRPFPYNFINYAGIRFSRTGIAQGSIQKLDGFEALPQMPYVYSYPGTANNNPPYINVNITEYGNIGEFMAGNFSGSLTGYYSNGSPNPNAHNVTCSFRVRRYF